MLIVEDGSGMPDADSFFALDQADLWLWARGIAAWEDADTTAQEAAARVAADYLGFAFTWRGAPLHAAQRLCWPRSGMQLQGGAVPANAVPRAVVEAAMLLAVQALQTGLLAPPDTNAPELASEKRELAGVGSIAREYRARAGGAAAGLMPMPQVAAMLAPYISGSPLDVGAAMAIVQVARA